ncbi:MAG: PDZ domain-containing protein, partial [Chloroflexi bacterium]|nr:PDZ domain-containing protein [Chloroflexota bacterium]
MKGKALISTVQTDSLADDLGLRPGDTLLAINGHPVRDILDYQFHISDEHLKLLIERKGRQIVCEAVNDESEPLGIGFEETTFDGIRRCGNKCVFCFVDRMPPDLRSSLYIKDDDYRYSFAFGSFVTLTNLSETDWKRLAEQRLSPLYVS